MLIGENLGNNHSTVGVDGQIQFTPGAARLRTPAPPFGLELNLWLYGEAPPGSNGQPTQRVI